MDNTKLFSRRDFLKSGAATAAGLAIGTLWPVRVASAASGRGGKFRFLHYTDIHVQPELSGDKGYAQCIDHMNKQRSDFAISGGDLVFDSLKANSRRKDLLWNEYLDVTKRFDIPVYQGMGNHDNFALSNPDVSSSDADYGKRAFLNRFKMSKPYYSFDHKGWHFIILDSIFPLKQGWEPRLDEAQMAWLKADLAQNQPKPIIVSLHVPVVTYASQLVHGPLTPASDGSIMHDAKELREMFEANNVKLVLQGHIHIREHFEYNDVHYITSGSVCGAWWRGAHRGHPEGYATIDVRGDKFEWNYHTFGWKAVAANPELFAPQEVFAQVA